MAEDDDKKPDAPDAEPEPANPDQRLEKILAARWDPDKLSTLMRAQGPSRGQRLGFSERSRFERRLGTDLGDVRIFTGELAEQITRQHNAEALTIGKTGMILMRQSAAYAPGSAAGTALLAHELTHVAQGRESAIARKSVEAPLAHEAASEAEAEAQEQAVHHEEVHGHVLASEGGGAAGSGAGSGSGGMSARERLEAIVEKVLELYEEEERLGHLRLGHDPNL
jgi:uncharacterized protein DUF4157